MATTTLQGCSSSSMMYSSSLVPMTTTTSSSGYQRGMKIKATINLPRLRTSNTSHLSLPKLPRGLLAEEFADMRVSFDKRPSPKTDVADPTVIAKLHAIMEIVADRMEMHKNIGEQRNNWNNLLLISINTITLTAATMTGIAAVAANCGAPLVALKLSSTILYVAATGMLMVMNKIQPSQLVEEQRNSSRLFKQLQSRMQTLLSHHRTPPTLSDVREMTEKVLALDKAYPLPLLGTKMIEKFPKKVEPAVWWPNHQQQEKQVGKNSNGWNGKLEEEMREIVKVLKEKDIADYMKLSEKALKLNKFLAISGPILTGLGAMGSAFVGCPANVGTLAVTLGVVAGSLASVVNTVEHGGQVGMVFEMYRSSAGFFKLMEESIECNLRERDFERRENGELFEMKVALQLGRSLSELKNLNASSRSEEFASKLF